MIEKMMEIINPGFKKELDSKKDLLENREQFVAENANAEEVDVMLEVMTSQNKIKRLKEEIPEMEKQLIAEREQVNNMFVQSKKAKDASEFIGELKKLSVAIRQFRERCLVGDLKGTCNTFEIRKYANMDGFHVVKFETLQDEIDHAISKLQREINRNDNNKAQYPKLKKYL